jgi:hypothetical protein
MSLSRPRYDVVPRCSLLLTKASAELADVVSSGSKELLAHTSDVRYDRIMP